MTVSYGSSRNRPTPRRTTPWWGHTFTTTGCSTSSRPCGPRDGASWRSPTSTTSTCVAASSATTWSPGGGPTPERPRVCCAWPLSWLGCHECHGHRGQRFHLNELHVLPVHRAGVIG